VVAIEPTPWYEREELMPCRGLLSAPAAFSHPAAAALGVRLRRELHTRDGLSGVAVEELVLQLIGAAAGGVASLEGRPLPTWLRQARDIVHESPRRALRVRDVAAQVGVHPVYLTRVFRERFGTSLGSYQRQRRLAWAAERLALGEPVAETALAAGFADQAHFTRAFKRFSGSTPARFRAGTGAPA
jgi:AraC family transcriptional regulator